MTIKHREPIMGMLDRHIGKPVCRRKADPVVGFLYKYARHNQASSKKTFPVERVRGEHSHCEHSGECRYRIAQRNRCYGFSNSSGAYFWRSSNCRMDKKEASYLENSSACIGSEHSVFLWRCANRNKLVIHRL